MPNKSVVLKTVLTVLIFVLLFTSFVYFFMMDQMIAFIKGRTTITKRVEVADSIEFPTIIMCLDPPTKLSVARKYGFQNHNDKFKVEIPNKNVTQVYDENTFELNQDYLIFNQHYEGPDRVIESGLTTIDEYYTHKKLPFRVDSIRTYHSGKCTNY